LKAEESYEKLRAGEIERVKQQAEIQAMQKSLIEFNFKVVAEL
jgi:hypothetical protein